MNANHLSVLATPILLSLMVAENFVRKAQGRAPYSQRQTLNNLGVFSGWRVLIASLGLVPLWGYESLFGPLAPWRLDPGHVGTWVLGFFAVDFVFWARHLGAHRVSVLWTMHAVHHQSREYNLSAAARLSWFSDTVLVGIPLALAGIPLEVTTVWYVASNVWQLFQHTEVVGRLGVFDRWLVTPSNHRVHHGCNPRYLDRNFGNVLLVWDRLFGTFAAEEEPVRYGVLTGLRTYDATENNLEPIRALVARMRGASTLWAGLQVPFRPPGWVPETGAEAAVMVDDPEPQRAVVLPQWVRHVSTALISVALAVALVVTWHAETWNAAVRVPIALAVLLGVAVAGVVLDARPIEPVAADTPWGRFRARLSAALLTLAGREARGPIHWLGLWVGPPVARAAARAADDPSPS